MTQGILSKTGKGYRGPGMRPWGLLSYPWAQPGDRSKLSIGSVRTHYIIVWSSDNLCISPRIPWNLGGKIWWNFYLLKVFCQRISEKAWAMRNFLKTYVLYWLSEKKYKIWKIFFKQAYVVLLDYIIFFRFLNSCETLGSQSTVRFLQ